MSTGAGAFALTFFSVSAPLLDDRARDLVVLDAMPTIAVADVVHRDAWLSQAFEITPTMLGPAITDEMLRSTDEDEAVVTMPVLEVHALPPTESDELAPPG